MTHRIICIMLYKKYKDNKDKGYYPQSMRLYIGREYAHLLLIASPGMVGLEYEMESESGVRSEGKFSGEEFAVSVDAIEVYRAWQSLEEKR